MTDFPKPILSGEQLRACVIAYQRFVEKEETRGSRIEDYLVTIEPKEGVVRILFRARRAQGEAAKFGGKTSLGRAIECQVSTADYSVVRWSYFR